MRRKSIGAVGFSGREMFSRLGGLGPEPQYVRLVLDGIVLVEGEVYEVEFVDGGFMITVKDPEPKAGDE